MAAFCQVSDRLQRRHLSLDFLSYLRDSRCMSEIAAGGLPQKRSLKDGLINKASALLGRSRSQAGPEITSVDGPPMEPILKDPNRIPRRLGNQLPNGSSASPQPEDSPPRGKGLVENRRDRTKDDRVTSAYGTWPTDYKRNDDALPGYIPADSMQSNVKTSSPSGDPGKSSSFFDMALRLSPYTEPQDRPQVEPRSSGSWIKPDTRTSPYGDSGTRGENKPATGAEPQVKSTETQASPFSTANNGPTESDRRRTAWLRREQPSSGSDNQDTGQEAARADVLGVLKARANKIDTGASSSSVAASVSPETAAAPAAVISPSEPESDALVQPAVSDEKTGKTGLVDVSPAQVGVTVEPLIAPRDQDAPPSQYGTEWWQRPTLVDDLVSEQKNAARTDFVNVLRAKADASATELAVAPDVAISENERTDVSSEPRFNTDSLGRLSDAELVKFSDANKGVPEESAIKRVLKDRGLLTMDKEVVGEHTTQELTDRYRYLRENGIDSPETAMLRETINDRLFGKEPVESQVAPEEAAAAGGPDVSRDPIDEDRVAGELLATAGGSGDSSGGKDLKLGLGDDSDMARDFEDPDKVIQGASMAEREAISSEEAQSVPEHEATREAVAQAYKEMHEEMVAKIMPSLEGANFGKMRASEKTAFLKRVRNGYKLSPKDYQRLDMLTDELFDQVNSHVERAQYLKRKSMTIRHSFVMTDGERVGFARGAPIVDLLDQVHKEWKPLTDKTDAGGVLTPEERKRNDHLERTSILLSGNSRAYLEQKTRRERAEGLPLLADQEAALWNERYPNHKVEGDGGIRRRILEGRELVLPANPREKKPKAKPDVVGVVAPTGYQGHEGTEMPDLMNGHVLPEAAAVVPSEPLSASEPSVLPPASETPFVPLDDELPWYLDDIPDGTSPRVAEAVGGGVIGVLGEVVKETEIEDKKEKKKRGLLGYLGAGGVGGIIGGAIVALFDRDGGTTINRYENTYIIQPPGQAIVREASPEATQRVLGTPTAEATATAPAQTSTSEPSTEPGVGGATVTQEASEPTATATVTAQATEEPTLTPSPESTATATPTTEATEEATATVTPEATETAEATATVETGTDAEAERVAVGLRSITIDEDGSSISKEMKDEGILAGGEDTMTMEQFAEKYNNDPDAIAWMMILNLDQYNADWKADGLAPRTAEEILETVKKIKEGTATMSDLLGSQDSTNADGGVVKGRSGLDRVLKGSTYIVPETDKDWGELSVALYKAEKAGTLDEFINNLQHAVKEKEAADVNAPIDVAASVQKAIDATYANGGPVREPIDNGKVVV